MTGEYKSFRELQDIAEKKGLKISFSKTVMVTRGEKQPKAVKRKYGKVKMVDCFKHLGETLSYNRGDKENNQIMGLFHYKGCVQ